MSFKDLLAKYRTVSFSERDKGERFERLMQAFLKTAPLYAGLFEHVWLWADFPCKATFSDRDTGIDLVARTKDGDFWAIQCKCYNDATRIDKPAVDSFLATSGKLIATDEGEVPFAQRLWISTTNNWGPEAEVTIESQDPPVARLSLFDLEPAPVDWDALEAGLSGSSARKAKKMPRPHQEDAIASVHEHFEHSDRGKIIMACGTGKTFTSLKIAEQEAGAGGLVLFLAPSIALVGQTLREWMAECSVPIFPICICSDSRVGRLKQKTEDEDIVSITDLAYPASTDVATIRERLAVADRQYKDHMVVVFSTYQSIAVISKAQETFQRDIDLIICDEAHRTTGVTLKGEDDSDFVRVHDNAFIRAKKRLYMTATPRLYAENSKKKASDIGATLCSMDDEALYGPEVYRIGFGEAVDKNLLSDYKVLVLTVTDSQIPESLQEALADGSKELNTDDAAKLMGCINALSKRMLLDEGVLKKTDPSPMRKAVAFCQTIKASKKITKVFNNFKDTYYKSLPGEELAEVVDVAADHVDGTMSAPVRDEKLAWLNSSPAEGHECRILTNARCLSEGVDVPSLDAVLFLSAKNSQIDVVQSVGRVMRAAPGKRFGYIIIPILVPSSIKPEEALNDNKRYAVVWTVLNALRAHDDRFEAVINRLEVNHSTDGRILVGTVGGRDASGSPDADGGGNGRQQMQLPLPYLRNLQDVIYARMVQKVGNKRYLEQWAQDVAKIAQLYIVRIAKLIAKEGPHKQAFDKMLADLRENINPSVSAGELIEMLAQHMITKPVFEALFENYSFVEHNPVSKALQGMVDLLEEQAFEKDTTVLSRFYESIKFRVANIASAAERQRTILELYDKFFRTAFPLTVEKLGIVYTPVEVVDFINQSVADLLQATFGRSLSDEDVHILDPFTGTGTFIVRMIESGLIDADALPRKYKRELHANEIVLLAYYIASINIENAYHAVRGEESGYEAFPGICLTDTFQLGEGGELSRSFPQLSENSDRAEEQRRTPIQVIIGNPPYSVGQRSANDNAQNQSYPKLEKRLADTYTARSAASSTKNLYDSYIKAFRWASDRIDRDTGGIVAFVSNAGWLDGNAMDGMRKCLEEEFSAIYVFNLRGNQRTSGELSRREGGKIFGSGSRTPIAITVLLKNPAHTGKALIQYHDIGDYLTREQKLEIVKQKASVLNPDFGWQRLISDMYGDWLNQRNQAFTNFISIGEKSKKICNTFFVPFYSLGVATGRDVWCWNFSKQKVEYNIKATVDYFNQHIVAREAAIDPKRISWSSAFDQDKARKHKKTFDVSNIITGCYRPFCRQNIYFSPQLNERVYQQPKLFPAQPHLENTVICINGVGDRKGFSSLVTNRIPDLELLEKAQCFPLYYYEPKKSTAPQLPGLTSDTPYERKDAITDFIHGECKALYGLNITKEDIFYYIYGLLHSPDYRKTFANDLKKSLPRLPLVDKPETFQAFSKAGRALANLHLNYEEQPPCPDVHVEGTETGNFRVEKMRFINKGDKSAIQYNESIRLSNIPLDAYDYVVNGRSAIEWIMDRYQVRTDSASGIMNDPNDWAAEHEKPRYILDLLLSIVTVSLETNKIVRGLPRLTF